MTARSSKCLINISSSHLQVSYEEDWKETSGSYSVSILSLPLLGCLLTQSNRSFTSSKWRNFKSSQATIHNHSITSCSHDMMKLNKMYAHHTSYLSRQLHKDIQTCPEVIVIPFSSTRPNEGIEEKCVCHIDWDLLLILFDLFTRQLKPPK